MITGKTSISCQRSYSSSLVSISWPLLARTKEWSCRHPFMAYQRTELVAITQLVLLMPDESTWPRGLGFEGFHFVNAKGGTSEPRVPHPSSHSGIHSTFLVSQPPCLCSGSVLKRAVFSANAIPSCPADLITLLGVKIAEKRFHSRLERAHPQRSRGDAQRVHRSERQRGSQSP
jgi:hypothetical protein